MTQQLEPLDTSAKTGETEIKVHSRRPRQIALPQTFSALRHRNFQLYFGGQLISVAGTWMQVVAQGWLVYELSKSEWTLGVVGFASAIPALFVSPWGGVIVDRMPKRTLLVITQAAAMLLALILAALAFTGKVEVWHIIALSAGLGLVNAFDGPARQAFVVEMVGRDELANGIALNSMMFNGARVIGPALAGLLLAAVGAGWCFFFNGISYIAVIAGLLMMKVNAPYFTRATVSPMQLLRQGLVYVFKDVNLFALLLLALIFSVFGISYATILPAFIDQVLKMGPDGFGWVNAATGLGAVFGAFIVGQYGNRGQRGVWLIWANLAFPFILIGFAYATNFYISMLLSFGLGLGFMLQFTLINTLLQINVIDEMRGRVLSLYTITFFGFAPFGNLAIGLLSESLGLSETVALSGLVALVLSVVVMLVVPKLRKMA
jgi:MFS family permease